MIIVLANGCFDGLHIGHVNHLRAARNLGDMLIVSLTADNYVNKGPGKPVFPWHWRSSMLRELRCVSDVVMTRSAEDAISWIKPDIFVKGIEYKGRLPEQTLVESLGGKVVFLDTQPVYSSTEILTGKLLNDRIRAAIQCRTQTDTVLR